MLLYLVFILPPLLFMLYAQWRVSSAYNRYSKVMNGKGMTGVQAAQALLNYSGLQDVRIEGTKGQLTDHYDPRHKVLRLSAGVAETRSVAALGIVAHEVGHAVQDKVAFAPMKIRSSLVPVVNLGSNLGPILVMAGFLLYSLGEGFGLNLAWVGVWLFAAAVLFTLVTLPVEFDASNRARQLLKATGMVSAEEFNGASAVLSAAALTYVAALLQALAQFIYFLMLASGMRRR